MKKLLPYLMVAALTVWAGTAMAATGQSMQQDNGFHALSHISQHMEGTSLQAFDDERLDTITGGYTPNPEGPIIVKWPFPFPWPGPVCLSCPYPLVDVGSLIINPKTLTQTLYR